MLKNLKNLHLLMVDITRSILVNKVVAPPIMVVTERKATMIIGKMEDKGMSPTLSLTGPL